ncbi:hypothetical protein [Anaeromusa sp.]|uniref:hypothetical protein n=1 Tax=Anaeromusa sp. TaxID=1872520 RepID=UPI00260DE0BB|nr:hypothetical protein [Anaeromusa sp.]MDD3157277.1 hypothetical protein [Anaeromusa sp.]
MTDEEKAALAKIGDTAIAATGLPKAKIAAYVGIAVLVLALIGGLAWLWHKNSATEDALQKAAVMTAAQAASSDYWQNQLNMSKQNADAAVAAVKAAQSGSLAPSVTFVQQSPTVGQAAETVAQRINSKDATLPAAALAKTDRTTVVPQQVAQKDGSQQWQVGVYKVNNYRNWEWGVGVGMQDGKKYVPIEIQRNYSRDRAISAEYHVGGGGGYEVKYKVMTDKLFFLF